MKQIHPHKEVCNPAGRIRGFSCVALDNPKSEVNVGGALRACGVYGASLMAVSGLRFKRVPTDTMKAYRHMPVVRVDDVFSALPFDCVPVAVDILGGAISLPEYAHPQRAFYVFGAEDATLGKRITDRCRDKVFIPMNGCMNLAATVNVVLYDRLAKQRRAA